MTLRPPTILLVDDESEILAALTRGLERSIDGSRVLTASDAHKALAILAREPVDVIISDNKMPGMPGIELLVEARRLAPDAARMMLTAYPEAHLIERNVNEAHVRCFFTKPYRLKEIVAKVRDVIETQRQRADRAVELAQAFSNAASDR